MFFFFLPSFSLTENSARLLCIAMELRSGFHGLCGHYDALQLAIFEICCSLAVEQMEVVCFESDSLIFIFPLSFFPPAVIRMLDLTLKSLCAAPFIHINHSQQEE